MMEGLVGQVLCASPESPGCEVILQDYGMITRGGSRFLFYHDVYPEFQSKRRSKAKDMRECAF